MPTKLSFRAFIAVLAALVPAVSWAAPKGVAFSNAPAQIEAYDYVEISAAIESPDAVDPFVDATFTGTFETADGLLRCSRWQHVSHTVYALPDRQL
jgi:hypothetical protein